MKHAQCIRTVWPSLCQLQIVVFIVEGGKVEAKHVVEQPCFNADFIRGQSLRLIVERRSCQAAAHSLAAFATIVKTARLIARRDGAIEQRCVIEVIVNPGLPGRFRIGDIRIIHRQHIAHRRAAQINLTGCGKAFALLPVMRYPCTRCNAEGWCNTIDQLSEPGIRGLRDKMLWEAEHITQFAGI